MEGVAGFSDPRVLVGYETADDAGVYQVDDNLALVQTTDFFTPVVDDPFLYGQIAAANALSDIYAMGAEPKFALSIVGFPDETLDLDILNQIIRGGAEKMGEARVPIIGGHSVRDRELKFGYAVTGFVHPQKIYRNFGAQPGDSLVLTKPLGTGIITTAIKFGKCEKAVAETATKWMLALNGPASQALDGLQVHAVTDVTGFGLLGHAYEMAVSSGVCLSFVWNAIPLLQGALSLAQAGMLPGGIEANARFVGDAVGWQDVNKVQRGILFDPQTSGGLLIALPASEAQELMGRYRERGIEAWVVGQAKPRETVYLTVINQG